jgi:CRP/FNR family transcriptional regulator
MIRGNVTMSSALSLDEAPFTSDSKILETLRENSTLRVLAARQYLFREYDKSNSVYLIEKGELVMERMSRNGKRQIVGLLTVGHIIGITAAEKYGYSAFTLTKAQVRKIPAPFFGDMSERNPAVARMTIAMMGERMVALTEHLFSVANKKAHERICYLVEKLSRHHSKARLRVVILHMTRQDIADYLALTPETVTRCLAKLQKDGIINMRRPREIELLDPGAILKLAE